MTEKSKKKVIQGKKSRSAGLRFEAKVRADLESKGWVCDKWSNNVELQKENSVDVSGISAKDGKFIYGKLVKVKNKWSGPGRPMMLGAGFPDFIAFVHDSKMKTISMIPTFNSKCYYFNDNIGPINPRFAIIGVESKMNGILTKIEKEKCEWYLKNNIFSRILIAQKGVKRGQIEYVEFNPKI